MEWREVRDEPPLDVAVVGAGVGGCYTAFRLAAAPGGGGPAARRVTLYERSHRTGGRIWSVGLDDGRGGWAELGAMRLDRGATSVMGLLDHLGLGSSLVPFSFGRDENLTYARGTLVRQRQLAAPAPALPYRLRPRERGRGPGELELLAVETLLPGFTRLRAGHHRAVERGHRRRAGEDAAAYRRLRDAAVVHGKPLCRAGWTGVLEATLSGEAVRCVHDTGGYDHHHGNAADWIDVLFHTPPRARYLTLSRGMGSLPAALRASFEAAGGRTRLGHRLCRVDRAAPDARRPHGAPLYELTFAREDATGRDTGERVRVRARTVVLALPQGALRRLDGPGRLFTPLMREDVEAVQAVPALKLYLAYAEPWWRELGLTTGRSTTDTPLRQLWYGGGTGPALLLAAYPNGPSAASWKRFHEGPRYAGPDDGVLGDAPRPSAAMVEHAHRLLCAMHGVRTPPPLAARWQDWDRAPHDGAWHLWRPGRSSAAVAARMRRPAPGEALYVVSDCWTSNPGSIPGALSCAEDVLQGGVGLAPPPWARASGP